METVSMCVRECRVVGMENEFYARAFVVHKNSFSELCST